jgi:hypothetical protein
MLGMILVRFVPALLVLAAIFAGIRLLYWFRASAMRALALRWVSNIQKAIPGFGFSQKTTVRYQLRFGCVAIQ